MALMWPSIEDSMDELMESYPERLKEAFNIRTIASVETYIDAEMLSLIVPLAIGLLAVRVMARAIPAAEERGHLDTLLAAPLARTVLVFGALVTTAIVVAEVLAVCTLMTWLAGTLSGSDPSLLLLARGFANVWPLALLFAGVAALAAGRLHRAGPVTGIAAGALVGMYVIDVVGKLAPSVEPLRSVSAFKYYGSAVQDGIDPLAFVVLCVAAAALTAAGAMLFDRRDVL
jgi:ABC-2 type transport system permease protein